MRAICTKWLWRITWPPKKRNLLDIALKNADLFVLFLVPVKNGCSGHEVVEMGLVKSSVLPAGRSTWPPLNFFIDARGQYKGYDPKSTTPGRMVPIAGRQTGADAIGSRWPRGKGGYLYAAVADVAAPTGNDSLAKAIDRIWKCGIKKFTCRAVSEPLQRRTFWRQL
jgi:hypothetical protein